MRLAEATGAAAWALALVAAGCTATNPAPKAWHRTVNQAQRSPFGAWVTVNQQNGHRFSGELIAVPAGQVIVGVDGGLRRIAIGAIQRVTVSAFATDNGGVMTVSILSGFSTISHGFFLIFSLPLWILIGGAFARSESAEGFLVADTPAEIADLRKWARFPQGMPAAKPATPVPPPQPHGADGQLCYPNATCDAGLVCDGTRNLCRAAPALGSDGGACYANRTCDAGLICTGATCARSP